MKCRTEILSTALIYEVGVTAYGEEDAESTIVRILLNGQNTLEPLQEFDGRKHDSENVDAALQCVGEYIRSGCCARKPEIPSVVGKVDKEQFVKRV